MIVSCCVMHANIISPAGQPDLSTGQRSHSTRASSSRSPRGWRTAWGFAPEDCGSSLRNTSSQIFIRGHGAERMLMKNTNTYAQGMWQSAWDAWQTRSPETHRELVKKSVSVVEFTAVRTMDSRSEEHSGSKRSERAALAGRSSADDHNAGIRWEADWEMLPSKICHAEEKTQDCLEAAFRFSCAH